jgi:hypothetical protein
LLSEGLICSRTGKDIKEFDSDTMERGSFAEQRTEVIKQTKRYDGIQ